eukprot:PhF_6_TR12868/c0_g1_i5/m.20225
MKCLNVYFILLVVFLSNSVAPQTVTHYCGAINLPNPTNSNCGDNAVCSRTTCMATPSDMIVNPYTSDVYVVETAAHRIRRIQYGTTGMVSTVVGFVSGVNGGDVDGLGTTIAKIKNPRSIDFSKPYLYFSDEGNNKVKRYNLASLLVATIANVSQITYPGALRVYNDRLYLSVVTGGITTGPNFYNQFQLYTPISAVGMNSVLLILEQDGNRMDVVTTTESVASLGTGCGFTKTRSTTIEYGT